MLASAFENNVAIVDEDDGGSVHYGLPKDVIDVIVKIVGPRDHRAIDQKELAL